MAETEHFPIVFMMAAVKDGSQFSQFCTLVYLFGSSVKAVLGIDLNVDQKSSVGSGIPTNILY